MMIGGLGDVHVVRSVDSLNNLLKNFFILQRDDWYLASHDNYILLHDCYFKFHLVYILTRVTKEFDPNSCLLSLLLHLSFKHTCTYRASITAILYSARSIGDGIYSSPLDLGLFGRLSSNWRRINPLNNFNTYRDLYRAFLPAHFTSNRISSRWWGAGGRAACWTVGLGSALWALSRGGGRILYVLGHLRWYWSNLAGLICSCQGCRLFIYRWYTLWLHHVELLCFSRCTSAVRPIQ